MNRKAPLRIRYPKTHKQHQSKEAVPTSSQNYNEYLERLVKLIPAEVLGVYLTIRNAASEDGEVNILETHPWVPVLGLFLVILVRIMGTRIPIIQTVSGQEVKRWNVEWGVVIISSISFFIWVYAMGDAFPLIREIDDNVVISSMVALWTFVIPYFYKPASIN